MQLYPEAVDDTLGMTREREREELRDKLARYEALAREYPDGPTAENIRQAIEELRQQLRDLDK